MTKVIGVRFRTAGKIYFFSPGEFEIKQGESSTDVLSVHQKRWTMIQWFSL